LLDAARVAFEQGSYDQAASIALAALADSTEINTTEAASMRAEAVRLMEEVDVGRRDARRPFHLVIAGDSLALPRPENAKTYDPRTSPRLHPTFDRSYPALLRDRLVGRYQRDVLVSNLSRASHGMPEVAADTYVSLFYLDPTAIVVHCGIVDCWPRDDAGGTPKADLAAFKAALHRFLSLRRQYCATKPVVLVGLAPTDSRWESRLPGINDTIARYSDELARVREPRTFFIDMRTIVNVSDSHRTLHLDGIHLNEKGHALLAEAIADRLRPEIVYAPVHPDESAGESR
jgi:lysophospholipase L1-like esterase